VQVGKLKLQAGDLVCSGAGVVGVVVDTNMSYSNPEYPSVNIYYVGYGLRMSFVSAIKLLQKGKKSEK